MADVNIELRDFLLRRQHYIHRFENGTIKNIVKHYHDAKPQIATSLQKLVDTGQGFGVQYQITRLQAQLNEIDFVLKNATVNGITDLSNTLNSFAWNEKEVYEKLLEDKFGKIGIITTRIPLEQINEIIDIPLGGLKYSERMMNNYGKAMIDIRAGLTQSIIQGEDMAKASRRLFGKGQAMGGGVGEKLMRNSEIITRTEIMRVSNQTQQKVYEANKDILKGVEFISTLDNRTCLLPQSLVYTKRGWITIEDVKVGDKVLTYNMRWRRITHKVKQVKEKYLKIKLSNGKYLKITPDHRVATKKGWIEIGELKPGDLIYGISVYQELLMDEIKIVSIEIVQEKTEVYDITVEEDASFLTEGIFVHNCIVCGSKDGKTYYYKKNPPTAIDVPPLHPYCRCILSPITKSWKELGEKIPPVYGASTRASFTGQVPATLSYSQWLKTQDDKFVEDILGPKRFKMWKDEDLSLNEMVKGNKVIPLEKLNFSST